MLPPSTPAPPAVGRSDLVLERPDPASDGMVMVYSASIAIAEAGRIPAIIPAYYLVRHGVFPGDRPGRRRFLPSRCRCRGWQQLRRGCSSLVSCCWLLVCSGRRARRQWARRWLSLGFINLQPPTDEALCRAIYAADYTVRKMPHMHDLKRPSCRWPAPWSRSACCCSKSRTSAPSS